MTSNYLTHRGYMLVEGGVVPSGPIKKKPSTEAGVYISLLHKQQTYAELAGFRVL
jgi:hypothetical protein